LTDDLEPLAAYAFPPTPDIAGAAAARLPARRSVRRARRALVVAVAGAVVLAAAVAAPPTRSGLVDFVDLLPGVRVERVDELPEAGYRLPPDYGTPVSLGEAARRTGMTLVVPEELGEPDDVLLDAANGAVTMSWGNSTRPRLLLTQWRGGEILFHKMLDYRSRTELVQVDRAWGIWIEGSDHDVFYGNERRVGGYLAGNVLAWHREGLNYRIEADVTKERALQLARTMRPV
jgi:hypothetical protein